MSSTTTTTNPTTAFLPSLPLPHSRRSPSTPRPRTLPKCSTTPPTRSLQQPPTAIPTPPPSTRSIITIDPFLPPPPRPTRTRPPRPVIIIPGYAADSASYNPMASALRASLPPNSYISVAPIRYHSWLATLGGRPVTPIINILHASVQKALADTGADSVTLVAHSAAGWIARIYLGDSPYPLPDIGHVWKGAELVHTLMCLGTPHDSAEPVTRNNMHFVNSTYPGSYHPDVRYLCLAGDGGSVEKTTKGHAWRFWHTDWFPRISYALTDAQTKGNACAGDGIVPLSVAFLENADRNIRLKGVWHSPASRGPWYGDPRVVDYWSSFLK